MYNRQFWFGDNGALVRAVRTFAQTAAAMITVASFSPFSVGAWGNVVVVSATAALVSLLMALDRREALMTPPPVERGAAEPAEVTAPEPVGLISPPSVYGCGDSVR